MRRTIILILLLGLAGTATAANGAPPYGQRWEIWLGVSNFPALNDIQPVASGSFDTTGFGIGGAWHFPTARFASSDLLFGVDGFVAATGSSIDGFIGELTARHLYLGGSVKWAFGARRNVYLDAGVGYHELDLAELSDYAYGVEHESWSTSTGGAFIGATWDLGAGRDDKQSGLTLSLKAHFADFGNVHDENTLFVGLLGPDAGELEGPVYMFQIGYGGR
jgi:hypothetical protein